MLNLDLHIVQSIRTRIKTHATETALKHKVADAWENITWQSFGAQLDALSRALLANGVDVQEHVAICSDNMPRWTIADLATMQIRAITVPIYATNTPKQTAYILDNAEVKILFVGAQTQFDAVCEIADTCPNLRLVVAMDDRIDLKDKPWAISWVEFVDMGTTAQDKALSQRLEQMNFDDLFTLIYTSGTTGNPKGVMLDYANMAAQLKGHNIRLNLTSDDVSLCFLPLSHVFERAWTFYVLYKGGVNCYVRDTGLIRAAITEIKPTVMCAVPRFYEKIYSSIYDKVSTAPFIRQKLFHWAIKTGIAMLKAKESGKKPSALLSASHKLADKLVFKKLRQALGGNIKTMPCGGAKLDPVIGQFFQAVGVNVLLGYGMTETLATISCWDKNNFDPSSIGTLMPGAEVKISAEHEILVKGPMVMRGYYKIDDDDVFDEQGFLRTGDAGHIDANGNLFITDRIKELMKTSGGKYIAPQVIEGAIGRDHFIEQIAIIADARKFVSALIVPCFDTLEHYAKELNIKYKDRFELIKHNQIVEMFEKRITGLQNELAKFEQVKKFKLLPKAFSMDEGELTPTLKLRRKIINAKYHQEIEAMYKEKSSAKRV